MKKLIEDILARNASIKRRIIATKSGEINILFVGQLTNRTNLAEYVIRPLQRFVQKGGKRINTRTLTKYIFEIDDMKVKTNPGEIENDVLSGSSVVILPKSAEYVAINTKEVEHKSIDSPQISYTLRGPKDSFTESMDVNLSLIRYRIKDSRLKTREFKVGQRTRTNVAMFYLDDVASDECVNEIAEKLGEIDVDGIIESGELQQFLVGEKWGLFPKMGIIERSDMACGAILEGKVVLLVEGSGLALVAPKTFSEFLTSGDDLYDNKFFGAYSKILRYISIIAMFVLMPAYVAVTSFNTEILSADYTITLASLRARVPFNALTEALITVFIVELLRESLLRVPKEVGAAIGMAGGVIIGQSVVSAGILSTLVLIIATLSLLMSFVAPDYTIVNPIRILQVFLIISAGLFGFFGLAAGLFVVVTKMISTSSFGVPFLAPHAPFLSRDTVKSVYYSKTDFVDRPSFLNLKDKIRGRKVK
ncbi:MAG: spore germination protein [Clostridiales bacterium]|jgi:spore germination protein KA/spore germination protein|nr:spore germination protein [Clostridiales bacterium]